MLELLENARINGNTPTFAPKARRSVCFSSHQPSRRRREGRLLTHDHPHCLVFQIYCVYVLYMYLLDVSIRDLKYFCVLFVLFVFLFMLLALLRCYTSIFDGFISFFPVNYFPSHFLFLTDFSFQNNKLFCFVCVKITSDDHGAHPIVICPYVITETRFPRLI